MINWLLTEEALGPRQSWLGCPCRSLAMRRCQPRPGWPGSGQSSTSPGSSPGTCPRQTGGAHGHGKVVKFLVSYHPHLGRLDKVLNEDGGLERGEKSVNASSGVLHGSCQLGLWDPDVNVEERLETVRMRGQIHFKHHITPLYSGSDSFILGKPPKNGKTFCGFPWEKKRNKCIFVFKGQV